MQNFWKVAILTLTPSPTGLHMQSWILCYKVSKNLSIPIVLWWCQRWLRHMICRYKILFWIRSEPVISRNECLLVQIKVHDSEISLSGAEHTNGCQVKPPWTPTFDTRTPNFLDSSQLGHYFYSFAKFGAPTFTVRVLLRKIISVHLCTCTATVGAKQF